MPGQDNGGGNSGDNAVNNFLMLSTIGAYAAPPSTEPVFDNLVFSTGDNATYSDGDNATATSEAP